MPNEIKPGDQVGISYDIRINEEVAFQKNETVVVERIKPNSQRPECRYVVLSTNLGTKFQLRDEDIYLKPETSPRLGKKFQPRDKDISLAPETPQRTVHRTKLTKCKKCGSVLGSRDIVCGECGTVDSKIVLANAEKAGFSPENCNHRYIRSLQNYICIYCGKVKPPNVPAPRRDSVDWDDTCGACGSTLDKTKFCTKCGAKIVYGKNPAGTQIADQTTPPVGQASRPKVNTEGWYSLIPIGGILIGLCVFLPWVTMYESWGKTESDSPFFYMSAANRNFPWSNWMMYGCILTILLAAVILVAGIVLVQKASARGHAIAAIIAGVAAGMQMLVIIVCSVGYSTEIHGTRSMSGVGTRPAEGVFVIGFLSLAVIVIGFLIFIRRGGLETLFGLGMHGSNVPIPAIFGNNENAKMSEEAPSGQVRQEPNGADSVVAMEEHLETKTCPYCAETVKSAAIKCRYCGSDLSIS